MALDGESGERSDEELAASASDGPARATRERLAAELLAYADEVAETAATMMAQLDVMRSGLDALLESLRAEADRLDAGPSGANDAPTVEPAPVEAAPAGSAPGEPASTSDSQDIDSARLIALDMALGGASREETAGYLADNFSLSDTARLLDEVYANVDESG